MRAPASHEADLEVAQEMEKGKSLPLNARAMNASRGIGRGSTQHIRFVYPPERRRDGGSTLRYTLAVVCTALIKQC